MKITIEITPKLFDGFRELFRGHRRAPQAEHEEFASARRCEMQLENQALAQLVRLLELAQGELIELSIIDAVDKLKFAHDAAKERCGE